MINRWLNTSWTIVPKKNKERFNELIIWNTLLCLLEDSCHIRQMCISIVLCLGKSAFSHFKVRINDSKCSFAYVGDRWGRPNPSMLRKCVSFCREIPNVKHTLQHSTGVSQASAIIEFHPSFMQHIWRNRCSDVHDSMLQNYQILGV